MSEGSITNAGVYGLVVSLHEGPSWLQVASAVQVEALIDDDRLVRYLEDHLGDGMESERMRSLEGALLVAQQAGAVRLADLLRRVLIASQGEA